MGERIWDKYLTERDRAVFAKSGFGATAGYGERPALLIIDVNYAFCGEKSEPILESIEGWRTSCGEDAWEAIPVIRNLIDACHTKGLPVIYTTGAPRRPDLWNRGAWGFKNSRADEDLKPQRHNRDGNEIVDEIAPIANDIVVLKEKPSGFFSTPMMSYLTHLKADSLIVTGTTTSGCVRATVTDAFSNNFRVAVVEDGCFDRSQASHAVSLCDMHAKYADVVPAAETLPFIEGLSGALFDLPKG